MSIPIDVVFVRSEKSQPQGGLQGSDKTTHVVCSVHEGLRPWKALPVGDRSARETLELPIGTIQRCAIAPGDRLCIS